ncbi:hypothetical protein [Sphingomonas sp.]|uniref:hypothetical protein n=1 Tax=Sphingomonas sp. TaxID=28214 RepID=UPI002C31B9B5|nr:hypothetical protein [Sphingomonas sp.]HTG38827.1 hypothetical protein [Sphingomonas sp.]
MTTETVNPAATDTTNGEGATARVRQAASDMADRSRSVAKKAAKRIDEATETTVDSAKRHPVSAAAIAVGAAAAVAGAAFGVSKLVEKRKAAPATGTTPAKKAPAKKTAAPRRKTSATKARTTNGAGTH